MKKDIRVCEDNVVMKTEIYYFSGTGNSYYVASYLAQKLSAEMKPIIRYKDKEEIISEASIVGLVFPIYDFKAPEIMYQFINRLQTPEDTYFFAVCTYGIKPLKTMKKLGAVLTLNDKKLSAGFTVNMPHNGLGYRMISREKQQKMFNDFKNKSEMILYQVTSKKQGHIEYSNIIDHLVLIGIFLRLMPKIIPMLLQAFLKGWNSLGFYSDGSCNGCGICSKICPVDNIQIYDHRPRWGDTCLNCFACFHWCPQRCIQIANLTKKMQRYHHPEVTRADIIKQKE
jgi:ferredoxin